MQARFALTFIIGKKPLPTKEEMEKDLEAETKALRDNNIPVERTHMLGKPRHKQYYKDLAVTAGVENVPDVYADILTDALEVLEQDPIGFHDNQYTLSKDKKTFERKKLKRTKRKISQI